MAEQRIQMVRGDTLSFAVEFVGLTQNLVSAYFTVRAAHDSEVLVQKSLSDGITKISTGKYRVRVAPADTASLTPGGYVYDFQVGIGSDIYTPLYGYLVLIDDVTR